VVSARAYTLGSLFAGIGGIDLAFEAAGFEIRWQLERDAYCQSVLEQHWPQVDRYGDIFDYSYLPYVDVITAGFPCQPFSVAGKRLGRRDERYLIPEMMRVIAEVQPRAILFENVPGFASLNDGREFKRLLGAVADLGYDAEWGHLRASDFGAPHKRERWLCVAYAEHAERRAGHTGQRAMGKPDCGVQARRHEGTGRLAERGEELAHAGGARLEVGTGVRGHAGAQQQAAQRSYYERGAEAGGGTQPGLGRDADGLSAWLDASSARWPAGPGQPQRAWEPPRVASGQPDRTKRLKALGNAVVPQVVYPLAVAIREWLQAQDAGESEDAVSGRSMIGQRAAEEVA